MTKATVINNPDTAQKYWNMLSPRECLYDEWEFRSLFFDPHSTEFAFYTIERNGEPIAMLPLQYFGDGDDEYVEFLGGQFMEFNRVFCISGAQDHVPLLIEQALNDDAVLDYMVGDFPAVRAGTPDPSYVLLLEDLQDEENIIRTCCPEKDRTTVRRLLNAPSAIRVNHAPDLDAMDAISAKLFGNESWCLDPLVRRGLHALPDSSFETHLLSILIDGVPESVSLGVIHGDAYYFLLSATNRLVLPGLSKLHIALLIREASRKGLITLQAGAGACGWKDRWHFMQTMLYTLDAEKDNKFSLQSVSEQCAPCT
jgi:hypothetical protein